MHFVVVIVVVVVVVVVVIIIIVVVVVVVVLVVAVVVHVVDKEDHYYTTLRLLQDVMHFVVPWFMMSPRFPQSFSAWQPFVVPVRSPLRHLPSLVLPTILQASCGTYAA
jgi:hypothetical protein